MAFGYVQVPAMFGVGQYTVTVQLPQAAGLYQTGNVTYRGTNVGRVTDGAADRRRRRRGGAVAELRMCDDPLGSDRGGAQHLGHR